MYWLARQKVLARGTTPVQLIYLDGSHPCRQVGIFWRFVHRTQVPACLPRDFVIFGRDGFTDLPPPARTYIIAGGFQTHVAPQMGGQREPVLARDGDIP